MTNSKAKLSIILCVVMLAVVAFTATSCGNIDNPDTPIESTTESQTVSAEEISVIGQGQKSFYLSVFYEDGTSDNVLINTNKNTVGEALIELGIIQGENGPYGLYIKTVNGVTADYNVTGTYWAFYINGNYAATSADMTEITDGALYSFRIE